MTETVPPEERQPISVEADDAAVDRVVDETLPDYRTRPPIRFFTADRRVVIAMSIAVACFALLSVVAIVTMTLIVDRQGNTIGSQDATIDVERSRSFQIEAQLADAKMQLDDTNNQALCRAQIANDYEDVRTRFDLLVNHRDQVFRESLSAALGQDREGFERLLAESGSLDAQIADLEPKVQSATAARRDSIATCAAKAAIAAQTTPGR